MGADRGIAALLIVGVAALAGCGSQRATPMIMASGDRAFERGDYELAASEYKAALEQRPGTVDAQVRLGASLLELGEPERARDYLESAFTLRPADNEVIELLALSMLRAGDFEALDTFLRGIVQDRPSARSWHRLGRFKAMAGDLDAAEEAMLIAARLDRGRSAEIQLSLANLYLEAGDRASAFERYRMVLYLEPENEAAGEAIRAMGEIPGPTLALPPTELASAGAGSE